MDNTDYIGSGKIQRYPQQPIQRHNLTGSFDWDSLSFAIEDEYAQNYEYMKNNL
ncbi:hypothetical protein FACS1894187_25090 [Synergistales bacterium]|nr:hypothetical protein FACS1894187_25090 [Synergistales bacterium]